MKQDRKAIKESIQSLVDSENFGEAADLIVQYQSIVPDDVEIYSMQAVVAILQKQYEKAYDSIRTGLKKDPENTDLLYNLAYLHELRGEYQKAFDTYTKVLNLKSEYTDLVQDALERLKKTKRKIAFFVKEGLDSFLGEVIKGLADEYETKKIIITNYKQIDEGMAWADICWFEWCDELIIYASNNELVKNKKIICRIHGYEVYNESILKTNWLNVDQLIVVTPHILRIFKEKVDPKQLTQTKIDLVYCGVDLERYPFNERKKGFNIGYLGYINFKKNIPLTLDIFYQLHLLDKRYKLYLAGSFQDERTFRYLQFFIKENKLEKYVFFDGWQNKEQKIKWFEKIDYMLISSIDEGLCYAAAESMASGIKPVLHKCEGLKDHYPKNILFTTHQEAVEMILSDNYNSHEYRKIIEKKYSNTLQASKINALLNSLNSSSTPKAADANKDNHTITISELQQSNELFIPYMSEDIDNYNFQDGYRILIGKKEKIVNSLELIEFIVENSTNQKLIFQNIWFDTKTKEVHLPTYLRQGKNTHYVMQALQTVIDTQVNQYSGFILDEAIIKDVKENMLAYVWERGIPATQFMPAISFLRVIERYKFAGTYIKKNHRVLEAPAGFGYGAAYFAKLCQEVHSIDIAENNITFAKSAYPMKNIVWDIGDVTKLAYDNNSFDAYVSFEVFEHLPVDIIDQYLKEAVRVLNKGGKFIVSTPNAEMRKHVHNPYHVKEYNFTEFNNELRKHFSKINYFSVVHAKVENGFREDAINLIAVCIK